MFNIDFYNFNLILRQHIAFVKFFKKKPFTPVCILNFKPHHHQFKS